MMSQPEFALVVCRYNHPEKERRAQHVREARAIARYLFSRGFVPLSSVLTLASEEDPPEDTPEVRPFVIAHSTAVAGLVGVSGGVAFIAGWYPLTDGMRTDLEAFRFGAMRSVWATGPEFARQVVLPVKLILPFLSDAGNPPAGGG